MTPPLKQKKAARSGKRRAADTTGGRAGKKAPGCALTAAERQRYARQLLVKEWGGEAGQLRLKQATVLVVGAGGSGSSLLLYLAAAGVGTILVCDGDVVETGNLNRQVIHDEGRIGMNKAVSAAKTIERLNSEITVVVYPAPLTADNIADIAKGCDLICCAADDRTAMGLLNSYAHAHGVPVLWGGGFYLGGFLALLQPPATPCIECCLAAIDAGNEQVRAGAFPEKAGMLVEKGAPNPIVGAAAGVAGAVQAMEAIKCLVGFGPSLYGVMLLFQMGGADLAFDLVDLEPMRRPGCPWCGGQRSRVKSSSPRSGRPFR